LSLSFPTVVSLPSLLSLPILDSQEKNISNQRLEQRRKVSRVTQWRKKPYKELQAAIKQAKKYHKTLISEYKNDFNPKVLNMMAENTLRLEQLRDLYKARIS